MLSQILKAFEKATEPLDLNELSRLLDVERSALDGMLDFLVRKRKLSEVTLGTEACAHCRRRLSCVQLQTVTLMDKAYELVE